MGPATDKLQAPTHRLKLYVRAVIESEARPTVMQLKMVTLISPNVTYLYVYIGAIEDGYTNFSQCDLFICFYRSYTRWLH